MIVSSAVWFKVKEGGRDGTSNIWADVRPHLSESLSPCFFPTNTLPPRPPS